MKTRTAPIDAATVADVLARYRVPDTLLDATALHLALPVDYVVGVNVVADGDGSWWVGDVQHVALRLSGDRAERIARAAVWATGVAAKTVLGRYLDVDESLVKIHRNGARAIANGADLLSGVTVAGDLTVDDAALAEVAQWVIDGAPVDLPMMATLAGRTYLVEREGSMWQIRDMEPTRREQPSADDAPARVEECAAYLGATFGGPVAAKILGTRAPATVDAEVSVAFADGWVAIVPVIVSPGAEIIGVDDDAAGDWPADGTVPAGWVLEGPAAFDHGFICRHEASGIRVRLVPPTN